MKSWYDSVKSITVSTEYRLDNNRVDTGPAFDDVESIPETVACCDPTCGVGKTVQSGGHPLLKHIANAVVNRERHVEIHSPCNGTKWQGNDPMICEYVLHIIAEIQYSA